MASLTEAELLVVSTEGQKSNLPAVGQADSLPSLSGSGNPWNYSTISGFFLLILVWTYKLCTTWQAWGNLTIDSGHEMYVPWLLLQGKQLYRDVWFLYGPAAPYFNSYLYRMFGVHLSVLYWAGSLSALGSAVFLYLTGIRLGSRLAGFGAAALLLLEAFQPTLFCFPLPYAFASVYGCLLACAFMWCAVAGVFSQRWGWTFAAGTAAAGALLLKLEFGMACYGTLALLLAARGFISRSWKHFAIDIASIFPGIVLCGLVIRWMVSIAGIEFITQENFMSWPTAYFMKVYGKRWLEGTGFTVSGEAFMGALHRVVPVLAVAAAASLLLRMKKHDTRSLLTRTLILSALALYFIKQNYFLLSTRENLTMLFTTIFFPRDMVLYVVVAAMIAWCVYLLRPAGPRNLAVALVFAFSGLLAFRILMKMRSIDYPIYYNGPVALCYLLILFKVVPRSGRSRRFVFISEAIICLALLAPVYSRVRAREAEARDFVPLITDRGTVRVSKDKAEAYARAIQFMKEKSALGETVLSVPEDTSLYFFSETQCPTRVYLFTPGVLAPGKMVKETVAQIEQKPVDYLLWSNRTFREYGVSVFGQDFDQELGNYFKSRFRPVGPLMSTSPKEDEWAADIWERKPESQLP